MPADMGALQLGLDIFAQGIIGVGDHHIGANPAALRQDGKFGDKDIGMAADVVGKLDVVLDHGVGADADMITDLILLPDKHMMPGLKVGADNIAGINDRVAADHRITADHRFQFPLPVSPGGQADDTKILDDHILTEFDIGIDFFHPFFP